MVPTRRRFSRARVNMRGRLRAEGCPVVAGELDNVSLRGAYFIVDSPPGVGLRCELWIELDGSEIEVNARGRIVRSDPGGCAIEITEVCGLESYEHLTSLVLFNVDDPEQAAKEIGAHWGLVPKEDPPLPTADVPATRYA